MAKFRAASSRAAALVLTIALLPLLGAHAAEAHELTLQGLSGPVADDRAVTAQPAQRTRSLFDRHTLWDAGQKLSVCFISGTPRARARVALYAAEWTRFANITLDFGDASAPRTCSGTGSEDIKIDFVRGDGHWSFVGRGSRQRTRSMNLAGLGDDLLPSGTNMRDLKRHVLHEFGHALGLKHEHQSPAAKCDEEIDWPVAYKFYESRQRWTREQTDENLRRLTTGRDEFSSYDPQSIMHYQLPEQFLKGGRANRCFVAVSYDLSAGDRTSIAKLYPGRTAPTEQVASADPRSTGAVPGLKTALSPAPPAAPLPPQTNAARPAQPTFFKPGQRETVAAVTPSRSRIEPADSRQPIPSRPQGPRPGEGAAMPRGTFAQVLDIVVRALWFTGASADPAARI